MTHTTINLRSAARAFYRQVDVNDPDVFHRWLVEDASFAFNDIHLIGGIEAIEAFVLDWKHNFRSLFHQFDNFTVDTNKSAVGIELRVRYVFHDGTEVNLKGASFLQFAGTKIASWRVYVDTSRLKT